MIFLGFTIASIIGLFLFYHGNIQIELWVYVSLAILILALILAIPTALLRFFVSFKKALDFMVFGGAFLVIILFSWFVLDPSSTTIFKRYVTDQNLASLSDVNASIDYEDNGNHVVRCKFNVNENDFNKILKLSDYSPQKNEYMLEFPSIRKLDWWEKDLANLPMYLGLAIKKHLKVAHINYLWYDEKSATGYFLQFRLPSDKDKELTNNMKILKNR